MVDNDLMSNVITGWFEKGLRTALEAALTSNDTKIVTYAKQEIYPVYLQAVKTNGGISVPEKLYCAFSKDQFYTEAIEEEQNEYIPLSVGRAW